MRPDFKYTVGTEVKLGSIITRITARDWGTSPRRPYYKVTNDSRWHLQEDLDYYEPLADWEKALLADWFAIGDRVTSKYGHRQGTIVDFDYAPDKTHPGVKWDGQTGEKSLHYLPSDLIKVEQDTNMLIPIDTKVEQIKGDDPRLKEFWEKAKAVADANGFCSEYDRLAKTLQTPAPVYETKKISVSIPVDITVEVEVEVGKEPLHQDISRAVQDLSGIRNALEASILAGNFYRGGFKLTTNSGEF